MSTSHRGQVITMGRDSERGCYLSCKEVSEPEYHFAWGRQILYVGPEGYGDAQEASKVTGLNSPREPHGD